MELIYLKLTDIYKINIYDLNELIQIDNSYKEFFSSKKISLICAILNMVFAVSALLQGSFFWGILCVCLGGYCYSNYLKD